MNEEEEIFIHIITKTPKIFKNQIFYNTNIFPSIITKIASLEKLNLNDDHFYSGFQEIKKLINLQELLFNVPYGIEELNKLQILDLSNNYIVEFPGIEKLIINLKKFDTEILIDKINMIMRIMKKFESIFKGKPILENISMCYPYCGEKSQNFSHWIFKFKTFEQDRNKIINHTDDLFLKFALTIKNKSMKIFMDSEEDYEDNIYY
ncbi:hypothetical protein BCR32DRAFT_286058 [Anaeromyces robustus]|uniref:L domain-like protein n=1 Tax=Anaeromyces robustus TaxID=1754192 RepID=A0A1Y1W6W3_9FUNG|nr:hypothetical protein BCR32DRAFT_286058 [Anaeromyces robustus]|eukprot:ORX68904.1 hypothetical protein BCR32DRAFT_286058 [Anaeromyces robustus]